MPKIANVHMRVEVVTAPAAEALDSARRALPAPTPRPEHDPADHMSFRNADGSWSRICLCACDVCWPPEAGKNPGSCPDWS